MKFRCFGLYGVLLRETYKNDSQGYFSNVTLYFTGKCSVKYPPGRVEYAETTKFILSFLYIVTVQCFYSVMAKCKSPLLMVIISLHFTKVKKRFLNVSDFAWLNWCSVLCLIHGWNSAKIIFVSLRNSQSHKLTESANPHIYRVWRQEKALCEFVSKLFEKLSIYISFFIMFFNIFQVTFIKLHSQTHKIEKTG